MIDGEASILQIPLKVPRLVLRQSTMQVSGDEIHLMLPAWFSGPWVVPLEQVALAARSVDDSSLATSPELPLADQLLIPFAQTTAFGSENLTLLFKEPQRVPAMTRLMRIGGAWSLAGFDPRKSASEEGLLFDGIRLRAGDPQAAVASLQGLGVEVVTNVASWFRVNRPLIQDPLDLTAVTVKRRMTRRIDTAASIVFAVALLLQFFTTWNSWITYVTIGLFLVAYSLARLVVGRQSSSPRCNRRDH